MAKDNNSSSASKGIGFTGLLQLVLITLKLLNKITWKWIWVLAPTWIYAIFIIILFVILVAGEVHERNRK